MLCRTLHRCWVLSRLWTWTAQAFHPAPTTCPAIRSPTRLDSPLDLHHAVHSRVVVHRRHVERGPVLPRHTVARHQLTGRLEHVDFISPSQTPGGAGQGESHTDTAARSKARAETAAGLQRDRAHQHGSKAQGTGFDDMDDDLPF